MNTLNDLLAAIPEIEEKIHYDFKDSAILVVAFTHRSYVNENREVTQQNERLEFLGDSVLGLVIAEYLYCNFPNIPEGNLSDLRSNLVDASACTEYLHKLGVGDYVLLGKGERKQENRGRESILADLFEALIGAIYMDGGIEAAKRFLFENFSREIENIIANPTYNWKSELQDYCQKIYQTTPSYEVLNESGPDHDKTFVIAAMIDDEELGRGKGSSKKEAQQEAAEDAMRNFQEEEA